MNISLVEPFSLSPASVYPFRSQRDTSLHCRWVCTFCLYQQGVCTTKGHESQNRDQTAAYLVCDSFPTCLRHAWTPHITHTFWPHITNTAFCLLSWWPLNLFPRPFHALSQNSCLFWECRWCRKNPNPLLKLLPYFQTQIWASARWDWKGKTKMLFQKKLADFASIRTKA